MGGGHQGRRRRWVGACVPLAVLFVGVVLVSSALADISSVGNLFGSRDVVLVTNRTNPRSSPPSA